MLVTVLFRGALLLGSVLLTLAVGELGLRMVDPFPYISPREINKTEHGNLTEYHPRLGWRGVPGGRTRFTTENTRTWLQHNAMGFRDIEAQARSPDKPAVVFLGDSFTWGYEVEFDEMFVSLLRERHKDFELFNLAHRGYGTDQALMTLRGWSSKRRLHRVVLMFSENDVADNNSKWRYDKSKPRFELREGTLTLTNVPVPKVPTWHSRKRLRAPSPPGPDWIEAWILRSHLLRDVELRIRQVGSPLGRQRGPFGVPDCDRLDLEVTRALLAEIRAEAEGRGATLVTFGIPSKGELYQGDEHLPYQRCLEALCRELGIEYHDLAPALKASWFRTYFRYGGHWTPRGHSVVADAIGDVLF
jgi:lysophospholipase L1-like esterase